MLWSLEPRSGLRILQGQITNNDDPYRGNARWILLGTLFTIQLERTAGINMSVMETGRRARVGVSGK